MKSGGNYVKLQRSRRTVLRLLVSAAAVAVATLPASAETVTLPVMPDAWSPAIAFRNPDGTYAAPWHAALLPDGRVFFIGVERETFEPGPPTEGSVITPNAFTMRPGQAPFPGEVVVDELAQPVAASGLRVGGFTVFDSLDCSGHGLLADGRLLTVGGTRGFKADGGGLTITGLPSATTYDGSSWRRLDAETGTPGKSGLTGRWYPTLTKLADGRMLVTGGFDAVTPDSLPNLSTEVFDPATNSFVGDSAFGQTPFDVYASDYPHVFTLPYANAPVDVMVIGETGVPMFHKVGGATNWDLTDLARPGSTPIEFPNHGATSAMLPVRLDNGRWGYANGSVLVAGGAHRSTANHSADVFDPVARTWLPRIDLQVGRHHGTSVILPDSRMLVVAGHEDEGDDARRAQYVDPAAGFAATIGASDGVEMRGYHNVALLLPDGRVLVGGGRDRVIATSGEKASFRYYYPWYMFTERPSVVEAPTEIAYGRPFPVVTTGPEVTEFVLMALGSVTHSFDQNQRSVQLQVTSSTDTAGRRTSTVVAPPDGATAPPGHYMLFAVTGGRVPSEATIVRVS